VKAFSLRGFSALNGGPFHIVDPRDAVAVTRPNELIGQSRLRAAGAVPEDPGGFADREGSDAQKESFLNSLDNAHLAADLAGGQGVRPVA
jgi:hypothetical protein